MKYIIPTIILSIIIYIQPGCKSTVSDIIDCSIESAFLSIHDNVDTTNSKLVHFEFVNSDTDGGFTLDQDIHWDFGDGKTETSSSLKIDHIYADTGSFSVIATYTLRRGDASCTGPKDKTVTIE
ncbi:MAG: PKD domain-containing protein [Bacteroidota bacterium]